MNYRHLRAERSEEKIHYEIVAESITVFAHPKEYRHTIML